jgi:hypothetical protein
MKLQKWKALVLFLGLIVFVASLVLSRQQPGPRADLATVFVAGVASNTAINSAPAHTDVPLPNQPTSPTPREEIVGVGLMLRMENGELQVAGLVPDSPATEAGLAGRIVIRKIDDASTSGLRLQECVQRLRGPAGSKVRLEVFDADANETRAVELTRRKLQL